MDWAPVLITNAGLARDAAAHRWARGNDIAARGGARSDAGAANPGFDPGAIENAAIGEPTGSTMPRVSRPLSLLKLTGPCHWPAADVETP